MFQKKKKSRVGQRHAWDKSISPKLCWDNELDEIITFYFFIILIPFLIDGRPICKKKKMVIIYITLIFVLLRVGHFCGP